MPIVYAQAYFTYGMLVALAPELPNNYASLLPFTVSAPPGVILNAEDPDPVSVRHVIGHFVTDLCLGAIAPALPDVVPAEGAGALWNFQASARVGRPDRLRATGRTAHVQQRWHRRATDPRRADRNRLPVRRHDHECRSHRADRPDRHLAQGDP